MPKHGSQLNQYLKFKQFLTYFVFLHKIRTLQTYEKTDIHTPSGFRTWSDGPEQGRDTGTDKNL